MLTLDDPRRWDVTAVEDLVTELGVAHDRLAAQHDAAPMARPSPAAWMGAAADAARAAHDAAAAHLRQLRDAAGAVRGAVAEAVDQISTLRRDLARAEGWAVRSGFVIDSDGAVIDLEQVTVAALQMAAVSAQRFGEQALLADTLREILAGAARIDVRLHEALSHTTDSPTIPAAVVPANPVPDLAAVPFGSSPERVVAWWAGLSLEQRAGLLAADPDALGNMDGLPGTVRDGVNRARLTGELARIDTALDAVEAALAAARTRPSTGRAGWEGRPGPVVARLAARVDQLRQQHDALVAIQAVITNPDRQLLLLDLDGHSAPRAAVAVGDVDTADHVAVFTPGFTATVATGLAPAVGSLVTLRQTATRRLAQTPGRAGERVAAVAWVGYDIPQWDTLTQPADSVLTDAAAVRGGVDLARFDDGLQASRSGHRPHFTALGHSYGATTTGAALTRTIQPVDDAVVFGAPGLGVGDRGALHVAAGHLDILTAGRDTIAATGMFGGAPSALPGVVNEPTGPAVAGDGAPLAGSWGHSDYLQPGTTSQYEIANTVAGLTDPGLRPQPAPTLPPTPRAPR